MKSMTMNLGNGTDIRLALNARQIASITEARGLAIEVLRGSIWVTFEGEYHDYILNPGEWLPIRRRGRMVIQGLAPSEVMFAPQPEVTPAIRAARNVAARRADRWRSFVASLSTGRLNLETAVGRV